MLLFIYFYSFITQLTIMNLERSSGNLLNLAELTSMSKRVPAVTMGHITHLQQPATRCQLLLDKVVWCYVPVVTLSLSLLSNIWYCSVS